MDEPDFEANLAALHAQNDTQEDDREMNEDDDLPDDEERARLLTFQVLTASAPAPVDDRYLYWGERPPELSERCIWWLDCLAVNHDLNDLTVQQLVDLTPPCANYDDSAEALGVWLWEWHHILYHVLANQIAEQRDREVSRSTSPWMVPRSKTPKIDLS